MCIFYLQLETVRCWYFTDVSNEQLRSFYQTFDVKSPRNENYIIDELCKFIAKQ